MVNPVIRLVVALCLMQAIVSPAQADGLGRSWKKLAESKAITIGYFGGSITEGAGASKASVSSWRALTTAWFRTQFPEAKITEINAGIGGTGSDFGSYRCQRDLLEKKPDLVFVEFAVNDAGAPDARAPYYEGVVRQILAANPAVDIVQVYTVHKASDSYPKGIIPPAVVSEQKIADHYHLPSVNVGKVLSETIQNGKGTWEILTKDMTHPSDEGYRLYADEMINFLQSHRNDVAEAPLFLAAPLNPNPVDHAAMIDAWTVEAPGWTKEDQTLAGRFPHRLAANAPGTELNFSFRGTAVGAFWLVSPDAGMIHYAIDKGPVKTVSVWDKYALLFTRSAAVMLAEGLPQGEHILHLKIAEEKANQSTGTWVRIGAFLAH